MNASVAVLDVSAIPFWRRLSTVLQALDALPSGQALDLVIDLDPWPLKEHLDVTRAGRFTWQVVESGPLAWRVRLKHL